MKKFAIILVLLSPFLMFGQKSRPTNMPSDFTELVDWILTGQETFTYKTLTSPTITGPSFTGTISTTGAINQTMVNAASGSANPYDYTGTLGIMNGSDDFTLFDVNMTSADHTGSSNTIQILDIANITGDTHSTETAIQIGTGWDSGIISNSLVFFNAGI